MHRCTARVLESSGSTRIVLVLPPPAAPATLAGVERDYRGETRPISSRIGRTAIRLAHEYIGYGGSSNATSLATMAVS